MGIPSGPSAYADTFARDHLPDPLAQPRYLWDHPALQYADRLNCGAELLDANVAAGHGDRPCLRDGEGRTWTYAEVLDRANRVANVLMYGHNLLPGNRVLMRGPNNPWLAVCWLAVQKAGLIAVVTMPLLRAGELRAIIDKAHVNLALCDTRFLDDLHSAAPDLPTLSYGDDSDLSEAMRHAAPSFVNCDTAADDVSLIAFTSGTTGQPKGCVHFHRDILAIADTFSAMIVKPSADDVFAGSPPLAFTFGLGGLLLFPMAAGACTVLVEKASPDTLPAAIARFEYGAYYRVWRIVKADQTTMFHDANTVGQLLSDIQRVRGKENRGSIFREVPQHIFQQADALRIETNSRFIHNKQLRSMK